jgi:CHAT domain/Lecithin:cholesterol acyltransferase
MAKKLKIPGAADDPAKKSKQEELEKAGAAAPMDIQVQEVVNVSAARAAGGEVTVKLEPLAPAGEALAGQVCEVEFEDGIKLWMRVGSLYRDFGRPRTRGAAPAPAEDVWEIAPIAARAPAARGSAREGAIRRVTIYKWEKIPAAVPPIATTSAKPSRRSAKSASRSRRGVVADVLVDAAGELVGEKIMEGIADRFAGRVGRWVESHQLGQQPGLYKQSLVDTLSLTSAEEFEGDKPFLLFLHGTMSSFEGSFGDLWDPRNKAGEDARKELARGYGAAYAWQHYTLTESPIDNALALAKRLPKKAKLHLVTHSRGGLIGDLLCLGQRQENGEPLAAKPLDELFEIAVGVEGRDGGEKRKAAQALRKAQAQRLADLVQVLKKNEIQVERYVRVACPARGTTLASNRLDRWLSIFKLLGDLVSPLKLPLKLLLALIAEHDDPKTLPGLEAQMPGSPLIRLLNLPALTVRADLSVIAGDTEASGFVGRLKELALDQFFEDESDVIVNTGAMYGGLKRADGGRFHLDSGSEVSHFNYFENAKTVRMLASGLARSEGSDAGFRPLAEAKEKEPVRGLKLSRAPAGPCPAVFLLPGIMGSHLTVNGDRLWLDVGELMLGGLKRLKMGVAGVAAESLFEDFYGDLAQHLAETHEVIPFAYDWRGSILDAGRILGDRVSEKLDEIERAGTNQPVRILAHSMGGLVARAMIAERPEVWRRMTAHEGARLIMLGTPNGGSHEIVRLLTSRASTLEQLGLLDWRHSAKDLLDVICGYPGVLELLPTGNDYECYSEQYWSGLRQSDEDVLRYPWEPPGAVDLKKAHRTWQTIEKKGLDPTRTLYVAGCAPATPIAWREEREYDYESGRETWLTLVFEASRRGDGQVPWDTGIPAGVKTWYLEDVSHGDLPDHEPAFPAYLELLQTGTTMRLSPAPPTGARGAVVDGRFDLPPERLDTLPNARDIAASALGASRRRKRPGLRLPKVEISVRHGNLGYARYPVCVGHYLGDTIVSAEDYLDTVLDGRLRKRHDLGLYPGRLGTFEVFLNPDRYEKPGGAIVVGLGQVGELSPGGLQSGIAQAALAYALQVAECPDERFGGTEGVPRSARLTSLLVGTGAGGMTVRDSIEAILRGVASANRRLHEARVSTQVWIDAVEFVELWQDIAIQATSGLERALLDGALADQFVWKDRSLVEGHGGRRRIVFEELPNWWHRVEIVHDRKADELRFIALTDRARAEETLVAGQLRLADDFISQAIAETQHGRDISRTLFEMLLPNRLKESAPNQYDIVLVVDEVSGRYPWELLEDRWSASNKPLSVAGGMLRQFKTAEFRERPVSSIEDKAYVVGNPVLPPLTKDFPFTELAGAESEAAAVADCLERHGFIVARQIHTHARDILMGLHREGYRVLHMAGHGIHDFEVVVEPRSMHSSEGQAAAVPAEFCVACEQPLLPKKKRVSGMVIGQGVFLTPGDVEQMRWVPELVFINCCHLGRVDSGPTPARWQYHHFAANVAAQFMRMG